MSGHWREYRISPDSSHHRLRGRPAYSARFQEVLKFHEPGLAPVIDDTGAYHITPDGRPAYSRRHRRTFGFYEGKAAVAAAEGWFHITPDGAPLYPERYAWCGNFQEGRCPARDFSGAYCHLDDRGRPAYAARYAYAGDYRDGYAVVQRADGRHSHIDANGNLLHGHWFLDLDVFHKNYARARDNRGWHHVDPAGVALYRRRFRNVEPFYNGQARVEQFDGALAVVDESGADVVKLSQPPRSPLQELSEDMVGLWKTQTIRAAVSLEVFENLPAFPQDLERQLGLASGMGIRLLRALRELNLVGLEADGRYQATERGALLSRQHPLSLADGALLWGGSTYDAWTGLARSLRKGQSGFAGSGNGDSFFDWLQDKPGELASYHRALSSYARHDYSELARAVDFGSHQSILDAGGGTGELSFALLRANPSLRCTVMDRPEVVALADPPAELAGRCRFVAGDLFQPWPAQAEAVALARVLHDWPDDAAGQILARAREAMPAGGVLYLVELLPDDTSGNGGLLDLNMLVMTGGAERTKEEYAGLLNRAGFRPLGAIPTAGVSSVIRAEAV